MQCAAMSHGLRVAPLPVRSVALSARRQSAAISCTAQPRRQQQAAAAAVAQPEAPSALLALSSLLLAGPALAEDAAPDAAAAADAAAAGFAAPSAAGWALALSPLIFYGLFNLYRSQIDPKAKFGDAIFVLAALILLSNIVSIVVFKIRLF